MLAYKWLNILGGLSPFPESEIESISEQLSDMFYYEVLNSSVPLKNGLDREEIKSELRQMRLNPDRWIRAVDWEGIVSLYAEETPNTTE